MSHLMRDKAPITDAAWAQIDAEATRSLTHFLAGRKLVDFSGPHGWEHSAVDLGRVQPLPAGPVEGVTATQRRVQPLIELRTPFTVSRAELDAADRGAPDLDLDAVMIAARAAAMAEDGSLFHGFGAAGVEGIAALTPHPTVAITDDYSDYPNHVAKAVAILRGADVGGPYAIALGARCYTGVIETTERGGYPVFEHLRMILGGPVVWAPAVDGAIVLSQRGGDFELVVGEDLSVGYLDHDAETVTLYIEESIAFRVNSPEAAVRLAY
ncbi:MAG: family 1 encapsulin nanocompartment shell protein [Acidimicrobiales bacterium]